MKNILKNLFKTIDFKTMDPEAKEILEENLWGLVESDLVESDNNVPNPEYSEIINNAISDNLTETCNILANHLRSALNDCEKSAKIIRQQRESLSKLDIMLSELHTKYSFHKVSDGLPPKGSNIIVYTKEHGYGIWEDCDPVNFEHNRITHWMYMPEEPAD